MHHDSVLLKEVLDQLQLSERTVIIDATLGLGGHSEAILQDVHFSGNVIGIDQDESHLKFARERLHDFGDRFTAWHANFARLAELTQEQAVSFDGILFDLGVASPHFDDPQRGFSLHEEGPLDMRMDPSGGKTAADVLRLESERDLAYILRVYGDEPLARQISRSLKQQLENINTTTALAELVAAEYHKRHRKSSRHPATRTFQALRIAVNEEMQVLEQAIDQAIEQISPGGRIVVISYHSLEDRLVKHAFRKAANPCTCPAKQPICTCGLTPQLEIITRKPILPSEEEVAMNPRARSAKMRVAQKI